MRRAAELTAVPGLGLGLSMEIVRRLADTLHLAVRAAHARALSAATTVADRPGAFPHAEAPAWAAGLVVVVGPVVAVAGVVNRRSLIEIPIEIPIECSLGSW